MGRTIAGVDIGAELFSVFGEDADTEISYTWYDTGGDQADINAGPVRVPTTYGCIGYPEAVRMTSVAEALVRDKMVVFGIYRDSLAVEPKDRDEVVYGDKVHVIYEVQTDSTHAIWVLYTQVEGAA